MKCGQEVQIVDPWGSIAAVAVSQCGDGFLMIVYHHDWRDRADAPFRNGERLWGWPVLLDRLVWLVAHPPSDLPAYTARTNGTTYARVMLHHSATAPLLATQLAAVLEAPADEVRAWLHDYIVVPEPVGESEGDHASDAGDQAPALG